MNASPAVLLALASAVEAGEGPDRELDFRIAKTLGLHCLVHASATNDNPAHRYTASVDAALALLADVLPGYGLTLDIGAVHPRGLAKGAEWIGMAHVRIYGWAPGRSVKAEAASVPRAIVAAVLRAVAGRGEG